MPVQNGFFKIYGEMKGIPKFITENIITESIEAAYEIENLMTDEEKSVRSNKKLSK